MELDESGWNTRKSAAVPPNRRYAGDRAFASVCNLNELNTVNITLEIKHLDHHEIIITFS